MICLITFGPIILLVTKHLAAMTLSTEGLREGDRFGKAQNSLGSKLNSQKMLKVKRDQRNVI